MDNKIIEKVKNLLALAEKAGTEAEAANASHHAQLLMSKYRISLVDVNSDFVGEVIKEHDGVECGMKISQWKLWLMNTICSVNGCSLIIRSQWNNYGAQRRNKTQLFVIAGYESDAEMCNVFYLYLKNMIEKLADSNRPSNLARGEGKNWSNSFKIGCTSTICEKLKQANALAKKEAVEEGTTTALAVIDNRDSEVRNYINKLNLKARQSSSSNLNDEAFHKGAAAGRSVNITPKLLK